MKRWLLIPLIAFAGCKKDSEEAPAVAPAPPELVEDEETTRADGKPLRAEHSADRIGEVTAPAVKIDPALVKKYLTYRTTVVTKGRAAVEKYRQETEETKKDKQAGSVRAQKLTEEFAVRMRAIEEKSREELKLSRDDVAAVGQVAAEVLAARQLWRMSGGDEAVAEARAELAKVPAAQRAKAEATLARNEAGFVEMKEARSARKRFGDAAVDAVLEFENELWKVQQDGAKVMAGVY